MSTRNKRIIDTPAVPDATPIFTILRTPGPDGSSHNFSFLGAKLTLRPEDVAPMVSGMVDVLMAWVRDSWTIRVGSDAEAAPKKKIYLV